MVCEQAAVRAGTDRQRSLAWKELEGTETASIRMGKHAAERSNDHGRMA